MAVAVCSCVQKTDAEKFADDLMSRMTLREKLGQMSQFVTSTGAVTGPQGEKMNIEQLVKAGEVGSILNIKTPEEIERMQRLAVDSSRLGIPILFGHDIIHGCKVIFPINLACACTWNTEAVKESARIAAAEAAAMGIAWTFSPMCDVSADSRWGRVSEGSGEDPYLGAKMSAAMVEGYQGEDLADSSTILACVKHFAAYGAPEAGRDYNTVTEMISHGVAADAKKAAYKALSAYLDMEMVSGSYLNHAEELIEEGLISEEMIDQMYRNVLVAKYNLGLFEDPFRYGGAERFAESIHKPEDMEFARKVARESVTVEFVLKAEEMAFCREDMQFAQEPGDFKVWIGDSSDASLEGQFRVK